MDKVINVVIVEDVVDIRQSLQALIAGTPGFNCAGAYATAEGAIMEIPLLMPDVVVMDINLPGMNGVDAVRRLKDKYKDIHFLMCTVFDDDENIFLALQAGAGGYILKNNSPQKILDAIKELHEGGSPMSATIARRIIHTFLNNKSATNTQRHTEKAPSILTDRETEVLQWLSKGFHYKEVASKLGLSADTIRSHCRHIYEKLHVTNKLEAINAVFGERS